MTRLGTLRVKPLITIGMYIFSEYMTLIRQCAVGLIIVLHVHLFGI